MPSSSVTSYTIQNVATPSMSKNFNTDTSTFIFVVNAYEEEVVVEEAY